MAEQVSRKGRFKNALKFGAYVRFKQVVAPVFVPFARSLRSRALPATRGPQKLSAAGLCPAKLCGTRPPRMERRIMVWAWMLWRPHASWNADVTMVWPWMLW